MAYTSDTRLAIDLEIEEGEEVIHSSHRHWIVLVQRGFIFALIGGLAAGLAIFRAIGGQFIESDVTEGGIDLVNVLLLGLIAALIALWWRSGRKVKKAQPLGVRLLYLLAISTLALAFVFRYQGGRLLYVNPNSAVGMDFFNLLLILFAVFMLAILAYIYSDWVSDFLILTTSRVVYEDRQEIPFTNLLFGEPIVVSRFTQQILLEDIQQVNLSQDSYIEYWLYRLFGRFGFERYGTLVIRSFSPQRLVFVNASNPNDIQKVIVAKVNEVRQLRKPDVLLRQMIEQEVYGIKPTRPPRPAIKTHVQTAGWLGWLFPPNPEYKSDKTIIWRPAWIYILWLMLRPVALLFLAPIIFGLLTSLGLLPSGWAFVLWLPIALISFGWAWWIYEEYRHDLYILTVKDITDLNKRPFGPQDRRQAPLSAVQDISYDVGFFENIFGFGNVVIQTGGAGGGKFTFEHVPNPRYVQTRINDYLTDLRREEQESQLKNTVTLIKEYHTVQGKHNELVDKDRLVEEITQRLATETTQYDLQEVARHIVNQSRADAKFIARHEIIRFLRRFRWR